MHFCAARCPPGNAAAAPAFAPKGNAPALFFCALSPPPGRYMLWAAYLPPGGANTAAGFGYCPTRSRAIRLRKSPIAPCRGNTGFGRRQQPPRALRANVAIRRIKTQVLSFPSSINRSFRVRFLRRARATFHRPVHSRGRSDGHCKSSTRLAPSAPR